MASTFPKAGARGLVRLEPDGDDWIVTALVLVGDEINSQTLKHIPIGALWVGMRTDQTLAPRLRNNQPKVAKKLSALIEDALKAESPGAETEWEPPARQPLSRPDRTDPDGHSRAVAAAYQEAVRLGKAPGPAIAAEAGVPVATAHGWIREARRRGALAAGRRGRAG